MTNWEDERVPDPTRYDIVGFDGDGTPHDPFLLPNPDGEVMLSLEVVGILDKLRSRFKAALGIARAEHHNHRAFMDMKKRLDDATARIRDHEEKAEAREAGTERARADYYKTLCDLQRWVIEDYRNFLFISTPQKINAVSPREWDLGRQVYFLDMNCKMLENLVDEYRKELEEAAKRIN